ncbi:glyoxalase [Scytonema sp. UIC 10036]|uniref:VOC family protein n=1 Tax=Scytonema sp. UIC 10036 TaxID=2304196 RepID=UPI0012DA4010|nr:VOC family protein [Scytonema sp. UIC 10036]MUG93859.1 glyoxalase [Scytonema sp. UIC 10036]
MAVKFSQKIAGTIVSSVVFVTIALTQNSVLSQVHRREDNRFTQTSQSQTLPLQAVVSTVESVGMTVSDMDKAIEFYSQVLSFKKVSDVEVLGTEYEKLQGLFGVRLRVVQMQLGDEFIELTEYLTPKGKPIPVDSRSNDRWFQHIAIAVSDMDKAYQHLRSYKVQHTSTAPQRIPDSNKAAAGIRAFYFKDPDGHNLEIIYFPPGKGDPKWQKPTNQLFLGIDHTAIVVSNTEASLKFYRDLLGLKLAGESMNYGTEQEHLNNVQGAKLRISALRSPAGPGIEFLEYLTPRDGRPLPTDARPNDLLHWQTTLVVKDAEAVARELRTRKSTFVSPDVVVIPKQTLGFKKGFLVRDPDGHVMRIVEK